MAQKNQLLIMCTLNKIYDNILRDPIYSSKLLKKKRFRIKHKGKIKKTYNNEDVNHTLGENKFHNFFL